MLTAGKLRLCEVSEKLGCCLSLPPQWCTTIDGGINSLFQLRTPGNAHRFPNDSLKAVSEEDGALSQ